MKLYFMKQDALEFMKTNMDVLYPKYFSNETSDWIDEEYGQEAFEVFKEVPDFELCSLEYGSSGEIDFENIQIVYKALINISESQASDERLWAGLCNKVFYSYLRRRWGYDKNDIKDAEKDMAGIISRFYFTSTARGYYFRNTISKCWWVGRLTYNTKYPEDPFYNLKVIGSSDLNTKITEIFYNSTFTSNPEILNGLFNALSLYYEKKIVLSTKEVLRPTFSYLNAIGGGILLDALTSIEITNILVDKINSILMGKEAPFIPIQEISDEIDLYDSTVKSDEEDVKDISYIKENLPMGITENSNTRTDIYADKGDTVILWIQEENREYQRKIPFNQASQNCYPIDIKLLGKTIGESIFLMGKHYLIKNIDKK